METDIYNKLRKQMDQYSVGFPETKSGIELKILKKLFTEEEAGIYLDLSLLLETAHSFADRTNRDMSYSVKLLETMAQKGLIFRHKKEDEARYAVVPFVIGSYEYQLKSMDEEFAKMIEAYFIEAMFDNLPAFISPLRTIPVNKSVSIKYKVAPYSDAKNIILSKKKIALADCICRTQQGFLDKGCNKPKEVCLIFGSHADYYIENGLGRLIDQEKALAVLDACEKAGLVNQPANMVNPGGMCNCCGDCCGILRALNKMPNPSEVVTNNFWVSVDSDLCSSCETCIDRCQMDAVSIDDDQVAAINTDRCIGCGLCVTTCPTEAMSLMLKPEEKRNKPPANGQDLILKTAEKRGTALEPLYMNKEL